MSFDDGLQQLDASDAKLRQRYFGKIQYLRVEHGYIRSRSKINGVRDITFNFLDMPRDVQRSLEVGDQVSFRINTFSSGKFCAVDVKKDCQEFYSTQSRSQSPVSISSNDSCDTSLKRSDSVFSSKTHSVSYVLNKEHDIDDMVSFANSYEVSMPLMCPSLSLYDVEKVEYRNCDLFSKVVNSFLEKVISRQYNATFTTCWLNN